MCWRKWEPCVSRGLLLMATSLTSKWPWFVIVSSSKDNHRSYFKRQLLGSNQELVLSQNKMKRELSNSTLKWSNTAQQLSSTIFKNLRKHQRRHQQIAQIRRYLTAAEEKKKNCQILMDLLRRGALPESRSLVLSLGGCLGVSHSLSTGLSLSASFFSTGT